MNPGLGCDWERGGRGEGVRWGGKGSGEGGTRGGIEDWEALAFPLPLLTATLPKYRADDTADGRVAEEEAVGQQDDLWAQSGLHPHQRAPGQPRLPGLGEDGGMGAFVGVFVGVEEEGVCREDARIALPLRGAAVEK